MKKLLFVTAILFAFLTTSLAQDGERQFEKFKMDLSLGYANFPGSNISNGFVFAIEPKFAVIDKLAIGGRFQSVWQYKQINDYDAYYGYYNDYDVLKIYASFSVTADYYFTNNYHFRPFAGAGAGVHLLSLTNTYVDYDTYDGSSTKTTFGGLARIGAEVNHFRFALEYNFVNDTKSSYGAYDNNGNYFTSYDVSKNSYIALKAGICFGGGPRERKRRHHRD